MASIDSLFSTPRVERLAGLAVAVVDVVLLGRVEVAHAHLLVLGELDAVVDGEQQVGDALLVADVQRAELDEAVVLEDAADGRRQPAMLGPPRRVGLRRLVRAQVPRIRLQKSDSL